MKYSHNHMSSMHFIDNIGLSQYEEFLIQNLLGFFIRTCGVAEVSLTGPSFFPSYPDKTPFVFNTWHASVFYSPMVLMFLTTKTFALILVGTTCRCPSLSCTEYIEHISPLVE